MKVAVSLGGSLIHCPQCSGDGYYEIGDVDGQACARTCPICHNGDDWYPEGAGWLELPLTPEHANRIYESGNDAAYQLVWDESRPPERSDFAACPFARRYDDDSGAGRTRACDYPECEGCAEYTEAVGRWDAALEAKEVSDAA